MDKKRNIIVVLPVPRFDKELFYPRGKKLIDSLKRIDHNKIFLFLWNNDGKKEEYDFDNVKVFKSSEISCDRGVGINIDYIKSYRSFVHNTKNAIKKILNPDKDIVLMNKQHSLPILKFCTHKLKAKYVFYDVSDIHTLDYKKRSGLKNKFSYITLNSMEKKVLKKIKGLILSSGGFLDYYDKFLQNNGVPNFIFENIPDYFETKNDMSQSVQLNTNKPKLGFVGNFRHYHLYENIIKLAEDDALEFLVFGIDSTKKLKCHSKVQYHGPFTYDKETMKGFYDSFDISCVLYPNVGNPKLALPNKLYESIYFNKPLLVSEDTFLSKIIKRNNIGLCISRKDDLKITITEFIHKYQTFQKETQHLNKKYNYSNNRDQLIKFIKGKD